MTENKKEIESYKINEIRWMYCDETPKMFLKSIEFDEETILEHLFGMTFESEAEAMENQLQINLTETPKKIRVKISVSVEEI